MQTKVHLPIAFGVAEGGRKVKVPTALPVYFPLGPIRNSHPWHGRLIQQVIERDVPVFVACPARPTELSNMSQHIFESDAAHYEVFPRQRAWENYYIARAMGLEEEWIEEDTGGCGHFHLGRKAKVETHPGKSYAQITMMEWGEMIATVQYRMPNLRVVVSYDEDFPEVSTVLYDLEVKAPQVPVFNTLEAGVNAALEIALQ